MGIPTDLETKVKESATVSQIVSLTLTCNFCGMTEHEVTCMIQGPSACICDHCVENITYTIRKVVPEFCKAEHMPEYDD